MVKRCELSIPICVDPLTRAVKLWQPLATLGWEEKTEDHAPEVLGSDSACSPSSEIRLYPDRTADSQSTAVRKRTSEDSD